MCIPKLQVLPIRFATFLYFSQNQKEISAFFSLFNFEYPACYCRAMEQYIFSLMLRGLSEWRDMVMFIESLVAERELVMNIDKQLKNV